MRSTRMCDSTRTVNIMQHAIDFLTRATSSRLTVVRRIKKKGNEDEKRRERERIHGRDIERNSEKQRTRVNRRKRWDVRGKVKQCVEIRWDKVGSKGIKQLWEERNEREKAFYYGRRYESCRITTLRWPRKSRRLYTL